MTNLGRTLRTVVRTKKIMIQSLCDRPIREENEAALTRRWHLVRADERNRLDLGMEFEFAKILGNLNLEEVKRAAATSVPLFRIGVDAHAMQNMLASAGAAPWPEGRVPDGTVHENEELLLNRWNIASRGDLKSFVRWALPRSTVTFLKRATLNDVRRIAGLGHPLCRLQVRPAYIWHAAKTVHLVDTQRDCLALGAATLNANG